MDKVDLYSFDGETKIGTTDLSHLEGYIPSFLWIKNQLYQRYRIDGVFRFIHEPSVAMKYDIDYTDEYLKIGLVQEFGRLIYDRGLNDLVDDIEKQSYGLSYLVDGKVPCAVVVHDGAFYDFQDNMVEVKIEDCPNYNSFNSLAELVDVMYEGGI